MKKNKENNKSKSNILKKILLILLIIVIAVGVDILINYINTKKREEQKTQKIAEITSKYNDFVKTTKNTTIYQEENNQYSSFGTLSKGIELELEKEKITDKTKYFHIKDSNYYISYKNLEKIKELSKVNTRYKKYIPFNENIETKNPTKIYLDEEKYIILNKTYSLPIIIKEEDSYGVELNDRLYFVKKNNVDKTIAKTNSTAKKKNKIMTLTYHFIYDPKERKCNQVICQSLNQFESHLKYIKDNNYLTLRLNELEMFLDKKINLPYKSVVLTIDDGTILSKQALRLLEQYEQYATLFLITGSVGKDQFASPFLDIESHSHDMHTPNKCPGMGLQGGRILCAKKEEAIADLKKSQEILGGSKYFSYPFFDVNNHAVEILKEAGFTMAFIGQYNTNGFSWPGIDKYRIPRKTVFNTMSMEEFKYLLS